MKHFGDITKIKGSDVPLVDIVCGGSPCQDLSIAGNRAGLSGERSGLFMEQIRIIKEMRNESTRQLSMRGSDVDFRLVSPRYMVWENVQGAFSSPGIKDGEDRRGEDPRPPFGKWTKSGCIMADGWSIAWRLHDAQFWGVPQRRKRIALVADFGGQSASEILFEREGVSGNNVESKEPREGAPGIIEDGADKTIYVLQENGIDRTERSGCNGKGWRENECYTLNTMDRPAVAICENIQGVDAYNQAITGEKAMAITGAATDPHHVPCVLFDAYQHHGWREGETCGTLTAGQNDGIRGDTPLVCSVFDGNRRHNYEKYGDVTETIQAHYETGGGNTPIVVGFGQSSFGGFSDSMTSLRASGGDNGGGSENVCVNKDQLTVRRLTPLECERLQGFPDGWTDIGEWVDSKGKKHKDADGPRYKALGNSIALPFWQWMAERMVKQLGKESPTMASLFDGIGGFPLVYSRVGCSPVWASEIEEFPIAVTKRRFPDL